MMKLELLKQENFNEVLLDFYRYEDNDVFMTAKQLGEALGYAYPQRSIDKIVTKANYLEDEEFSVINKVKATDGKSYNTRVFTEDGIYEVAMLSKRPEANKFREFVRKLLKGLRKGELELTQTTKNTINPMEQARIWAQNIEKNKALH